MPITCHTVRRQNTDKPWISDSILMFTKRKNRYHRDSLKKRSLHSISTYKLYKSKLNKVIKAAQKLYYQHKFENIKNNMK